jgi:hypothetical protein
VLRFKFPGKKREARGGIAPLLCAAGGRVITGSNLGEGSSECLNSTGPAPHWFLAFSHYSTIASRLPR